MCGPVLALNQALSLALALSLSLALALALALALPLALALAVTCSLRAAPVCFWSLKTLLAAAVMRFWICEITYSDTGQRG